MILIAFLFRENDVVCMNISNIELCKSLLENWTNVIYEERNIYVSKIRMNLEEKVDTTVKENELMLDNIICTVENIKDAELEYIFKIRIKNQYAYLINDILKDVIEYRL